MRGASASGQAWHVRESTLLLTQSKILSSNDIIKILQTYDGSPFRATVGRDFKSTQLCKF